MFSFLFNTCASISVSRELIRIFRISRLPLLAARCKLDIPFSPYKKEEEKQMIYQKYNEINKEIARKYHLEASELSIPIMQLQIESLVQQNSEIYVNILVHMINKYCYRFRNLFITSGHSEANAELLFLEIVGQKWGEKTDLNKYMSSNGQS